MFREVIILIALALAFLVLYVLPLDLGILFLDRLPTSVGISDISAVQRKAINLTILALGPLLFFFFVCGFFFLAPRILPCLPLLCYPYKLGGENKIRMFRSTDLHHFSSWNCVWRDCSSDGHHSLLA
jgi:hypothetical protein